MKLTCPKCHGKLGIADNRLPATGAWARCPKCGDRFYITLTTASPKPETGGKAAAASSPPAKARTSLDGPPFVLGQIIVFPQETRQHWLISSLTIIGLSLMILGAVWLIKSTGALRRWNEQDRSVFGPQAYGLEELKQDLRFLKKITTAQHHLNQETLTEGAEHRIFNYYLGCCSQSGCQRAKRLNLSSAAPKNGLTLTALCSPYAESGPNLNINWSETLAVLEAFEGSEIDRISLK